MKLFKPLLWSLLALVLSVSGGIAEGTLKIGHITGRTGWLKGPALSAQQFPPTTVEGPLNPIPSGSIKSGTYGI